MKPVSPVNGLGVIYDPDVVRLNFKDQARTRDYIGGFALQKAGTANLWKREPMNMRTNRHDRQ
ncbi:hypothetical protein SBDP1_530011 [Syntrophobacter sp. SbD1]|nr:hypothetical protein SBDP1_530011 [Syntrophobacter sp. SbD1]